MTPADILSWSARPGRRAQLSLWGFVAVLVALSASGVAWLSMSPGGMAKDFTLSWTAATHVLSGRDPYLEMRPTGMYPFNVPFYYPLPAAILAIPFAALPVRFAGIAFVGVSFGVAAFLLMRDDPKRVTILLSFPAVMAATLGQWSPLLVAATIAPVTQVVLPVKPTLGAAAFASRPSRLGVLLSLAILSACFLLDPTWLASWRSTVSGAWTSYTAPVRWGRGAGLVLLSALIFWRDRDARLLGVMAVAPQLPLFYDQLLVQTVARSARELWILVGASWIGGMAWALQPMPNDGHERPATLLILVTIYLPALGLIAWRRMVRPPVVRSVPDSQEFPVA